MEDLSDETESEFDTKVHLMYTDHGEEKSFEAVGNGPIDSKEDYSCRYSSRFSLDSLSSGGIDHQIAYIRGQRYIKK